MNNPSLVPYAGFSNVGWRYPSIQWIKIRETDYVIHWKEIYLVDSVIHLSKNWALVVCYTAVFRVVTQRSSCGEERRVTTLKTAV